MEEEFFLSGYCRAIDQSRMVTTEIREGNLETDCAYPDCPYSPACQIAEKLRQLETA